MLITRDDDLLSVDLPQLVETCSHAQEDSILLSFHPGLFEVIDMEVGDFDVTAKGEVYYFKYGKRAKAVVYRGKELLGQSKTGFDEQEQAFFKCIRPCRGGVVLAGQALDAMGRCESVLELMSKDGQVRSCHKKNIMKETGEPTHLLIIPVRNIDLIVVSRWAEIIDVLMAVKNKLHFVTSIKLPSDGSFYTNPGQCVSMVSRARRVRVLLTTRYSVQQFEFRY